MSSMVVSPAPALPRNTELFQHLMGLDLSKAFGRVFTDNNSFPFCNRPKITEGRLQTQIECKGKEHAFCRNNQHVGSAILQNGDPRQRHAGLLIGNQGNSLEGLGHLTVHWWMLGGHRWSVVYIPMSWMFKHDELGLPSAGGTFEIRCFPFFVAVPRLFFWGRGFYDLVLDFKVCSWSWRLWPSF